MQILVCGGAGYIGSHCADLLLEKSYSVVVVDNLSTGHRKAVPDKAIFYHGDIRSGEFLDKVFSENSISTVMHFSACSLVGESAQNPFKYYSNNTYGTLCLLEAMNRNGVKKIIFSSTAAVYGEGKGSKEKLLTEEHDTNPTNCYGETKLAIEKMLSWVEKAYNIKHVIFRYFNVAGAYPQGKIGEDHNPETHLIPLVLKTALGQREQIEIFGNDYATPDGTCIRDYIHVMDLVECHILAIDYLESKFKNKVEGNNSNTFNLGYGRGFSVKEIINTCEKVTQKTIKKKQGQRRIGDPACLIADSNKAIVQFNWKFNYNNLEDIITSAYHWHENFKNGYEKK